MNHNLKDNWWRWGVGLLVIAGLSGWLYTTFEWRTEEVESGPTEEARQNPYLALQMFLQQRNQQTAFQRGFRGLEDLRLNGQRLGQKDALVLTHTYQTLQEPQVASLWHWVSQGGTLVVAAHNPHIPANGAMQDTLLERMGLVLATGYKDSTATSGEAGESDPAGLLDPADDSPTEPSDCERGAEHPVTWPGEDETLKLRTDAGTHLYPDESDVQVLAASDQEHAVLTRYPHGAGVIYVLAHDFSLRNDYIACGDNGYVAWKMLAHAPKAWFAINTDTPSFWSQLWHVSPAACLALLAALGMWVWQRGIRFGPIHRINRSQRRQFLDHIRASATFVYRHQGNTPLIQTLRDDIHQRMRMRDSSYNPLSPARQLDKLRQATSMSEEDLRLAMQSPLPVPSGQFVDVVKRLQLLRNHL